MLYLMAGWLVLLAASLFGLSPAPGPADLNRVVVGTIAPDFELPFAGGGTVRLSSLRGKNVVLVFYRGYW